MKYLYVTLREPPDERNPMHAFVVEHPEFERTELVAWNTVRPDFDVFLFRVVGPVAPYQEALESTDFVASYDLTSIDDESFYAYVEHETRPADLEFRAPLFEKRLLAVPPVVFDGNGEIRLRLVGRPDDLERFVADLPDDIETTVEGIGEYDAGRTGFESVLTDRQSEALDVAFDVGYYEVPRTGSVADVADELDCAESTAATHLRKAESRIVSRFLS